MIEGSLEVKLPTIWTDGKAEVGRVREEKRRSEKIKEEKDSGRKVAIDFVFPMICGSGGSKSRLAKKAGAEPCGQMTDKKLHAVVARSTFGSKNAKNTLPSDALRRRKSARRCGAKHVSKSKVLKTVGLGPLLEVEMFKAHAIVARSTFPSQNVQKHISFGPLLEVEMFKKRTPLWREAHFQVKMYKTHQLWTTFGS